MKNHQLKVILLIFTLLFSPFVWASGGDNELMHQMVNLVFQVSIILVLARIGGSLVEKIKMPRVLGEILVGVIIGPYCLGSFALPGFEHGIFQAAHSFPVSPELYGLTTIASIVLLFLVGLETDIDTFLTFSVAGSGVGIGGVLFSFIFGDLTTVLCAKWLFGVSYNFSDPIPLFLGVISTATSVGISARILSEKRKMNSPEGVTILSGAVIDDVLGIILLAIVLGIVKSGHVEWTSIAKISFKAILIWLGFTSLGLYFSRQLSDFLKKFNDKLAMTCISFAFALFLSGIFEKSGLAMIIGAYITGLSLSKTDISFVIQERLEILYHFLVPIFFCVMGMLVNLHELADPKVILFGLVYVVTAVIGKIIGCGLPALFLNFNMRGAFRIGVGMTPRGEVGLIIAGIGLSTGILPPDYFGIVIMMTFITTLLTPPVFSKLMESDKPVLKKNVQANPDIEEVSYTMPNEETMEFILSKVINAFETEGFYIHRIPRESMYQIRKNQTFITMNYSPTKIVFICQNKDLAFIHTLFYEVIAELEKVMNNIQNLSYKSKVGKQIFSQKNKPQCEICKPQYHRISPNTVEIMLKGKTKKDIINEMLDLIDHDGKIKDRKLAYHDIMEREKSMSTGMQDGIALPHARTNSVGELVCAIGVIKNGVDFDSLDKKPAKIIVLTLTPKESTESQLQFLANISKNVLTKDNRGKILSIKSNWELYEFLSQFI